jgi:cell wall-associated NlpC family hydrolase
VARPVKYNKADTVRVYDTPLASPDTASVYQRTMNPTGAASGQAVTAPSAPAQQQSVFQPKQQVPVVKPSVQPVSTIEATPQYNAKQYQDYLSQVLGVPDFFNNPNTPLSNADRVKDDASSSARATSPFGKSVVNVARQYTKADNPYNNHYVYGQWDCSKFTQTIAHKSGVSIPRTAASQYSYFKNKRQLYGLKQARAGDLIFMRSSASPSGWHVGIYIGKGQMIDNAGRGVPIKVRSIAGRTILGFGRMNGKVKVKSDRNGRVAGTQLIK